MRNLIQKITTTIPLYNLLTLLGLCFFICVSYFLESVDFYLLLCFTTTLLVYGALCVVKLPSRTLFYFYLGCLFYVNYFKLIFPPLPFGFVPDVFFMLFIARLMLFERTQFIKKIFNSRFFLPNIIVAFFLIINFAELFNPILPSIMTGAQTIRAVFKIIFVYWGAVYLLSSYDEARSFINFAQINIFITFLFSFKQILFGFSGFELAVYCPPPVRRIFSTYANAAVLSVMLGIGALDFYLRALYKKRIYYIYISIAYLAVSTLTLHRSPLLATLIALFAVSIANLKFTEKFFLKNIHTIILIFLLCLGGLAAASTMHLPDKYSRLRDQIFTRNAKFFKKGMAEGSLKVRRGQAMSAMEAIRKYPMGGGLGYTNLSNEDHWDKFSVIKGLNRGKALVSLPKGTGDNTFFTVFVELGVIGFFSFVCMILYFLITAFLKRLKEINLDENMKYIYSLSFGIALIISISIITSSIFYYLIVVYL